jgi:hypothetical protein
VNDGKKDCVHEEIKCNLNSGNVCYHAVKNLLSPRLLFKNVKFKEKNYNFTFCLRGRETWSLTLREDHRLRVFEKSVHRRIFGPKRDEVTGDWRENYILRSSIISTVHQILLR